MKVTRSHTYDAPVDEVISMFGDPDAVTERYEGMGHRDVQILECDRGDDTLSVVCSRVVDVDLPGFAKKVLSPTNTMVQKDRWNRSGEGWDGSFDVDVAGAPVEMSGTMTLSTDGERTVHEVTIEMKVKVPLVGGKIADWTGKNEIPKTMEAEFDAGDEWLANNK